jgi:hypothetical protein
MRASFDFCKKCYRGNTHFLPLFNTRRTRQTSLAGSRSRTSYRTSVGSTPPSAPSFAAFFILSCRRLSSHVRIRFNSYSRSIDIDRRGPASIYSEHCLLASLSSTLRNSNKILIACLSSTLQIGHITAWLCRRVHYGHMHICMAEPG